jgi:hypothetical protein
MTTLTDTITAAGLTYNELDELWKVLHRGQRDVGAQQHYISQMAVKLGAVTTYRGDRASVDDTLDGLWEELDTIWHETLDLMDDVNNAEGLTTISRWWRH